MSREFVLSFLPALTVTLERLAKLRAMVSELSPDYEGDIDDICNALDWLATDLDEDLEVIIFRYEGLPYPLILSGCMSDGYGTDAMDHMNALLECEPIYRQIETWALEDWTVKGPQ